jgi:hypothetical protein
MSYRRVTKRPEIKRTRRFVGFRQVWRNIAVKAIEFIEQVAYDTETEVLEAGEQQVVHWAINVEEPWGPNNTARVVAYRTGGDKPASGATFEVITVEDPAQRNGNGTEPQVARRPRNHERARERIRAALQRDGHYDPEAGMPPADD